MNTIVLPKHLTEVIRKAQVELKREIQPETIKVYRRFSEFHQNITCDDSEGSQENEHIIVYSFGMTTFVFKGIFCGDPNYLIFQEEEFVTECVIHTNTTEYELYDFMHILSVRCPSILSMFYETDEILQIAQESAHGEMEDGFYLDQVKTKIMEARFWHGEWRSKSKR